MKLKQILNRILVTASLVAGATSCVQVPQTIQFDTSVPYTEINGYKFHTESYGDSTLPLLIVVHGGPGGDFEYLRSLANLADRYRVIFYDQRGNGLSPRVDKQQLTLEQNLLDLHAIVKHFSNEEKVKLVGHSWGGMLVSGYLSEYPEHVSQAVIIEPGMLNQAAAQAFVSNMKQVQSVTDMLTLVKHILVYPFVSQNDEHEGFDYVMTKILNRSKPGGPYQCEGESMPENVFKRGGFEAFNNMLRPVMDDPATFSYDLTDGINNYAGDLMLISSECSLFGYEFQQQFHMPHLPSQTIHLEAKAMGHNMLTLNPEWSLEVLNDFFKQ